MLGPAMGELLNRMVHRKLLPEDEETLRFLSPERNFAGQELLK
jgi:hypothetical protein